MFGAYDPDANAIVSYSFWNTGTDGGRFYLNGIAQAVGAEIDVTSAQLAQLTYRGIAGPDTLWVKASDGTLSSAWSTGFTVTRTESAPRLTVNNTVLSHSQTSVAASSLFNAVDIDGDTVVSYAFWNTGAGGGRFYLNGVAQAIGAEIDISSSQLSQMTYRPGSSTDTLWVKAGDGSLTSAWSNDFQVMRTETAPTAYMLSGVLPYAQSSDPLTSMLYPNDGDGDAVTSYTLWDKGDGGGHLVLNGQTQATGVALTFTASQYSQLSYVPGTGTDTLWARLSDGVLTGAWSNPYYFTEATSMSGATMEVAPVVTVVDRAMQHFETTVNAYNLFSAIDPNHDTVTNYAFWNNGSGGGHFALNGVTQAAGQEIDVTASQLNNLTYVVGSANDTLWVKAGDGTLTSGWSNPFTVSPGSDQAPTLITANKTEPNGGVYPGSNLFTAIDSDGDQIKTYAVWDTGAGGAHFSLNNVAQATNQEIDLTAGQLSDLGYSVGTLGSTDTIWVKAGDGQFVSPWSSSFTVTPT